MLKPSVFILFSFLIFVSCEKKPITDKYETYYNLKVDGVKNSVYACGTSSMVAEYIRSDTTIFVGFGCGGKRSGFYIKGHHEDGTYNFEGNNSAWYDEAGASFQTTTNYKGTITIKSIYRRVSASSYISYITGNFSFDAIDIITNRIIHVSEGKYFLIKTEY